MRFLAFWCTAFVLVLAPAFAARGAAGTIEVTTIAGKEYVRLSQWAKANDVKVQWIKRDESLQLLKGTNRLTLGVDSREATVNGINLLLSFALLTRNGNPMLSRVDADNAVKPLLSAPRMQSARVKTICLDPGHGGRDSGNRTGNSYEKKYTLLLAEELRTQLKRAGFKVLVTRSSDEFIDLPVRPQIASNRKADLFVSLHFNHSGDGGRAVKGIETYCLTPPGAPSTNAQGEKSDEGWFAGNRYNDRSLLLAYLVQKSLVANLGGEDRGIKRARFKVLRDATMPAILVEGGFMSNPAEAGKIFSADYRRKLAKAVVNGLLTYKRAVELPTSSL